MRGIDGLAGRKMCGQVGDFFNAILSLESGLRRALSDERRASRGFEAQST